MSFVDDAMKQRVKEILLYDEDIYAVSEYYKIN